ncbi:MAG: peptide chain release factor N(5)-glutamine methyltransferase [Thioalkalispiraceae bacterium]|jgi:release factor glutamine methyltransferase
MTKTLGAVHQEAIEQLKPCSDSARLDADLILSYALDIPRTRFITQAETPVSEVQYKRIIDFINKRRTGLPVSYITGTKGFWDLELIVNEHTLIPRPETELLIEFALTVLPAHKPINVIDLGTGTGAIALAIAKSRPLWNVTACDKSEQALEIARQNCKKYQLNNVDIISSDWFANIPEGASYDLIISNPPYVAEQDPHLHQGDVRFEPISALSSGPDGLNDIRQIVISARNYLSQYGWLIVEHGFDQGESVKSLFSDQGYQTIQQGLDLNGHTRATYGQR